MIEGGALLPLGGDRDARRPQGLLPLRDGRHPLRRLERRQLGAVRAAVRASPGDPEPERRQGDRPFLRRSAIDGFIEPDEFKRQIDEWIRVFRATKPAPGTNGPLIPGDPEREAEAIRQEQGIPLVSAVVVDLRDIAKQTGIPFD